MTAPWRISDAPREWDEPVWAVRNADEASAPESVAPVEYSLQDAERMASIALGIPASQFGSRDPARGITPAMLLNLRTSILDVLTEWRAARVGGDRSKLDALDVELKGYVIRIARDRSAVGRDLLLLRLAALSEDSADWISRASRMIGGRALRVAEQRDFLDAMQQRNIKRARRLIEQFKRVPPSRTREVVAQ